MTERASGMTECASERSTSSERGGTYPVPNVLADALLPTLRDTEVRVLLIVLRQTWGWKDPTTGQLKTRDWLAHTRLARLTGRANTAVSSAVDGLCRQGLISVEDKEGRPLTTPQERRRRAGVLYFRPGPNLLAPSYSESEKPKDHVPSSFGQPASRHGATFPQSEESFSQSTETLPQSGFQKAETTTNRINKKESTFQNAESNSRDAFRIPRDLLPKIPPDLVSADEVAIRWHGVAPGGAEPLTEAQKARIKFIKGQITERLAAIRPASRHE